ncbi:MAG: sulfite exporter TauE/SafE family protein [Actinomycetota bacterium]|nr:sulfite exporter TauE/SafE family protein [Actinomycetota bacterium]
MSLARALVIFAVGLAAGTINTIVGSGSLITFPTLLALGYSPVVANVSNTVGLVPGSVSGAIGYRRELAGQRSRLVFLGIASAAGGITGAVLLLVLPGSVFRRIVPVLILVACALAAAQPRLSARLARRRSASEEAGPTHGGPALFGTVYLTGVYGGYFGAAQGVILIALLGIFLEEDLQRVNAAKNVLAALVNGVAALLFIAAAHVAWGAAGALAVGATIGGQVGAKVGRRLPEALLRWIIVAVGTAVAVRLLV